MEIKGNIVVAEEGKLLFRKSDNEIMGTVVRLGADDVADNYYESAPESEINTALNL